MSSSNLRLRVRAALVTSARVLSLATLVFYGVLTVVSVMPLNPIKVALKRHAPQQLFDRYFYQNWNLFAPNPVSADLSVEAKCLTADERDAAAAGTKLDGFTNLTEPLWRENQRSRFTAYGRLFRPQTAVARELLYGMGDARPLVRACQAGEKLACDVYKRRREIEQASAKAKLARIGSSYCADVDRTGDRGFVAVAMRVREEGPTPWPNRAQKAGQTRVVDAGVLPLDRSIAAPGLFAASTVTVAQHAHKEAIQ